MPQTRITADNLAPLVDILTWFLLVTSITGVAVRGATKAAIIHIVGLDDALITIALVSILQGPPAVWRQSLTYLGSQSSSALVSPARLQCRPRMVSESPSLHFLH